MLGVERFLSKGKAPAKNPAETNSAESGKPYRRVACQKADKALCCIKTNATRDNTSHTPAWAWPALNNL